MRTYKEISVYQINKKYIENIRMRSHLRMYEKFILFSVKYDLCMLQLVISTVFSLVSAKKMKG